MPILAELPLDQTPHKLADWMELNALLDSDGNTSRQELVGILSNGAEAEGEDQIEESESEQLAESILSEIATREVNSGGGYPFYLDESVLRVKEDAYEYPGYIFCLLISYFGTEYKDYPVGRRVFAKYFETMSAAALKELLFDNKLASKVKVFGFPRDEGNGFEDALKELCEEILEMTPRNLEAAKTKKDAGLDIILWIPFLDSRSGSLVFWGQCAMGRKWDEKLYESNNFDSFVHMPTTAMKGIFIPHTVDTSTKANMEEWNIATERAGRIFDRCRIAHLTKEWINAEVKTFCEQTIKSMQPA